MKRAKTIYDKMTMPELKHLGMAIFLLHTVAGGDPEKMPIPFSNALIRDIPGLPTSIKVRAVRAMFPVLNPGSIAEILKVERTTVYGQTAKRTR